MSSNDLNIADEVKQTSNVVFRQGFRFRNDDNTSQNSPNYENNEDDDIYKEITFCDIDNYESEDESYNLHEPTHEPQSQNTVEQMEICQNPQIFDEFLKEGVATIYNDNSPYRNEEMTACRDLSCITVQVFGSLVKKEINNYNS